MHILSIIRIIGILVMCFSGTMLIPAFVALIYGDGGGKAFMQAFMLSLTAGTLLWWPCHHHKQELRSRDGFLIVVAFWFVLGGLATLPLLLFDAPHLTVASAVFEAFSGLTTTGATVMTGLDNLPKAILFYRQFLQWLGGMGIIVLAIAIIPLLGIGGMQLYRAEMSGPMKEQKIRPRITETAKVLWMIYLSLTLSCALAYWLAGMSVFDAITHSFSTVSIGGFSTHDASIGYFNSPLINGITVLFLLVSACNFGLHFRAFSTIGRENFFKIYLRDPEFRFFISIQVILVGVCTSVMWGGIFNLATNGLGKYTAAASGIFMVMVCGGGILPALQGWVADVVGYIQSYWVIVLALAYLLFYALAGSKNVNTDIKVD